MGRKYTIDTGFQTVSAVQDLVEILNPADAVMLVPSISVDQSSDAASTEAEKLQLVMKRASGTYTSGSGGGTVTPAVLEFGDAAAGITAERNNTTQAVAGTGALATMANFVYDVLSGFEWTPIPELRPVFSPSQALVLSLTAPADALTLRCLVIVEELGG